MSNNKCYENNADQTFVGKLRSDGTLDYVAADSSDESE